MTMSAHANIESTAEKRARCVGSSMACRSIMYPEERRRQTKSDVSRGSHAHQMPHMMRPQIIPVNRVMVAKASDTSVIEAATESNRRSFLIMYAIPQNIAAKNPIKDVK